MKKILFGMMVIAGGLVACNNDATTGENADTTITNTTATTTTSSGDYAAMASEFETNSAAGKYRDMRTGKTIKITVDKSTGAKLNAETREPITRYIYVDNSDWWLYDDAGERIGRVKYENDKVLYDEDGNWVDYDTWVMNGGDTKYKSGDTKVKVDEDGTKIKSGDKKIKTDEDGTKVKN